MTDFVSTWNKDSFLTYPVGPLGLIAMPGTEEMGQKVNSWLKKWQDHTEESMPGDMSTTPGAERQDFLIDVSLPRFGNGEGKGMVRLFAYTYIVPDSRRFIIFWHILYNKEEF